MLTVSLHGITMQSKAGLYAEEQELYNHFEVDIDVYVPAGNAKSLPFVDYTILRSTVAEAFDRKHDLLEQFITDIHQSLSEKFTEAEKIKVTVRKLHPPMAGEVKYAQVTYEGK